MLSVPLLGSVCPTFAGCFQRLCLESTSKKMCLNSLVKKAKYIRNIHSLNRPLFASSVAIARIERTSTIILRIFSVIAAVGVMPGPV
jgi:hypothetical protein